MMRAIGMRVVAAAALIASGTGLVTGLPFLLIATLFAFDPPGPAADGTAGLFIAILWTTPVLLVMSLAASILCLAQPTTKTFAVALGTVLLGGLIAEAILDPLHLRDHPATEPCDTNRIAHAGACPATGD